MPDQSSIPYDVVIAGAGPVGLFLACELRLAGLQVLVLEQSQDSHSALKQLPFGLRGLSISTLEAFHRKRRSRPIRKGLAWGLQSVDQRVCKSLAGGMEAATTENYEVRP
ncbi:FAD-dependent monooxygenase, partial [Bradyrhizobium diazoefficiens]|uniref:FAD-dependent oxidoreductase n=2 Tax=Bradyrhizobium diazoefficiens TaxID=1355477 RepID=UPI001B8C9263